MEENILVLHISIYGSVFSVSFMEKSLSCIMSSLYKFTNFVIHGGLELSRAINSRYRSHVVIRG